VTGLREHGFAQKLLGSQPFWVTVALVVICLVMSYLQPEAFATYDNFYNITRNFAFVGLMALGMTAVILTGGIDISVGSIMGLVGVVCGVILEAEQHWFLAVVGGLAAAPSWVPSTARWWPTPACRRSWSRWACSRSRARWRSCSPATG
jgi:ribose transport system permease protein